MRLLPIVVALNSLVVIRVSPALAAEVSGSRAISLPGGDPHVDMDYLAVDSPQWRVWVPAGGTGQVDVIDLESGAVHSIDGFPTVERDWHGHTRRVGPSSATVGAGYVYVGNRADASVCAVSTRTLSKEGCVTLPTAPDGLCFIPATQEVWVTTPHGSSITILDVHQPEAPVIAGTLSLGGKPEGYAFDTAKGVFFTNLEDHDLTVGFDVKERREVSRWPAGCGSEGPRGLAVDSAQQTLFVACTDRVVSEDLAAAGKPINQLPTGAGVDNIDYLPAWHRLYVAAGKAARLTTARSNHGQLTLESVTDSVPGGRVVVVDAAGQAFVADSARGQIQIFAAPH